MTAADTRPEAKAKQRARPFVAPGYALRKVPFDAPYSWLAAGWRDMGHGPRVSLAYADPNAQEILTTSAQRWERLAAKLADAEELMKQLFDERDKHVA